MSRSHLRLGLVMFSLLLALGFSFGSAGVAHAEPGPRPTLTPIPPVTEPAPVPPAAPQQVVEEPAPTAKPRKSIVVVVTPIAPVQPVTVAPESAVAPASPLLEGANFNVRYVVPGNETTTAAATAANVAGSTNLLSSLFSNQALLIGLMALDIMAICVVVRRRFAR